ncbi:MAG TPA: TetR family transcriptional regulator [Paracoccaceae bacterium]|nr:TetR family transcriptional regulator [Paracoccaceae bacterium]HMO73197.1 TetR family transcriptional regulator [Paracoccaceae bacterium]
MSTARKTRSETAADTRAALVATARRAFADEGFGAVALDALADRAGVTRGALHHHFGNKAGLFEAVLREVDAELSCDMQAAWDAAGDPWAGFQACFHAYLDAALAPDRRRILFQDAPAVLGLKAVDILMESGFGELVADLRAQMAAGRVRALDPEALAHMLNGATINLAFWAAEAPPDEDRLPRAHATLAALFDGLAP